MQQEKQRQVQELQEFDAFCIKEQLAQEERKEFEVPYPLFLYAERCIHPSLWENTGVS